MRSIGQEGAGGPGGNGDTLFQTLEQKGVFMPTLDHTDVLVCGAGPVGMLGALILANDGVRVRIIDQEPRVSGHSYSCALHSRSLELLESVGIADKAIAMGRRIHTVAFYEGKDRRAEVKLSALPGKYPFALVIEQGALESLLEQGLRAKNVKIGWNQRLAHLEVDELGATARVQELCMSGKGYGVPEFDVEVKRESEIAAKYVIGADGVGSTVRSELGVLIEKIRPAQRFQVYEFEAEGLWSGETRVVLDKSFSSVLWPLHDNRGRWSFQIPANPEGEDFPAKERDRIIIVERPGVDDRIHQLREMIQDRAPWFDIPIREITWTAEAQFEPRLARHFGRKSCWLVGDAAHQAGPVGMHSMNLGFVEVADLVKILVQLVKHDGAPEALRDFDQSHWTDWNRLLRSKPDTVVTPKAGDWARANVDRIVASLPASGPDLANLLKQVGLNFP